jgi:hypothetical protein
VTAHPTAEWTSQQLRNAFPFEHFPRYLLRDRDAIFGQEFREQVQDMGIAEVLSTPRSPWQRAYVERVIGSIRREFLDHVIVFDEASLRRILASYFDYYHESRTHLSLEKDSLEPRPVHPQEIGPVMSLCVKLVDCTTATNAAPPEGTKSSSAPQKRREISRLKRAERIPVALRFAPRTQRVLTIEQRHRILVVGACARWPFEIVVRHRSLLHRVLGAAGVVYAVSRRRGKTTDAPIPAHVSGQGAEESELAANPTDDGGPECGSGRAWEKCGWPPRTPSKRGLENGDG